MRQIVLLDEDRRIRAFKAVREAPLGMVVSVKEPTRTNEQNAAMWPILEAFSAQVTWPVNGKMVFMDSDDWKCVLTAAYRRESVRLAMALDGAGGVMLGMRTSQMGKREFSEFLEFLKATAIDRGVTL